MVTLRISGVNQRLSHSAANESHTEAPQIPIPITRFRRAIVLLLGRAAHHVSCAPHLPQTLMSRQLSKCPSREPQTPHSPGEDELCKPGRSVDNSSRLFGSVEVWGLTGSDRSGGWLELLCSSRGRQRTFQPIDCGRITAPLYPLRSTSHREFWQSQTMSSKGTMNKSLLPSLTHTLSLVPEDPSSRSTKPIPRPSTITLSPGWRILRIRPCHFLHRSHHGLRLSASQSNPAEV